MSFLKDKKNEIDSLFQIIKNHINSNYDVVINDFEELSKKTRIKEFVYARKLMMVILGEKFGKDYTQKQIAKIFNLDRTSFIHHSKKHLQEYTTYPDYKKEYDQLRDSFDVDMEPENV